MSRVRDNWRIVLLVLLLLASTVALFAPAGGSADASNASDGNTSGGSAADTGPTNLRYGLELSGGTRVRAPLVGMTAEGVQVAPDEEFDVEGQVASQLDVGRADVRVAARTNTVEVFADDEHGNVTRAEFASALQSAGLDVSEDQIRPGVTAATRQDAVRVLNDKINQGGLAGGQSTVTTTPTGQHFVLVEVPGATRSEVLDLIGTPGRVEIVAHYPVQEGSNRTYRNVSLFDQSGIASVGQAQEGRGANPAYVPVSLEETAARNFSESMRNFGFTSDEATRGQGQCNWRNDREDAGWCLFTVLDGEVVYAASMSPDLAGTIENGGFVEQPTFRMTATSMDQARELQLNLNAGALPTDLAIRTRGTTYYLQPSLAQEFKFFSLLTGFVAVLAVAFVVFLRYGRPQVSIPMLLTAGAEVYLLLGFAAAIGLALDLSHIAGFIAVIGTGIDDLVIIADEIMQRGEIRTDRVFQSRFKKAFWVIGAAAATTIIAMTPLAALSLGDLQGFAIVTIVGVLIGVLITRPAYGDILRNLVVD